MNRLFLLLAALVLTSCTATQKSSEYSSEQLQGVWTLKYNGQGNYSFSQLAFTSDGRKCVLAYDFDRAGNISMDYYLNSFVIEDGVLITEVGFSSTQYLPAGYIIKDRIDRITSNEFDVFMIQPAGSLPEKHQRLSGVDPEAICKVVSGYAHNKSIMKDNAQKRRKASY